MNRIRLFTQAELAAAFALILPADSAHECAREWFERFAAEDDIDSDGYFLVDQELETEDPNELDSAISASSDSESPPDEEEHSNLKGMSIEKKRRWLLSFSDFHLGLLALSSPELTRRVQSYLRETDDGVIRRQRQMQRIVQALTQ